MDFACSLARNLQLDAAAGGDMIILGLMPIASLFVSWFVHYYRAGLADIKASEDAHWLEFLYPNFSWFLLMWAKTFTWPLVFVVWLTQGRPKSPWRAVTSINGRPVRSIIRVTT
jgi:hypothetical protein